MRNQSIDDVRHQPKIEIRILFWIPRVLKGSHGYLPCFFGENFAKLTRFAALLLFLDSFAAETNSNKKFRFKA